ncbi:MAG: HDIG domain-containing protein [Methanomassiliicoccales archaeon]|nr:HDIG domain-containing protein [Methanomassiliicoccales archaeon]
MDRAEVLDLVREHVSKENNLKHMLAVGAVMRETALRLDRDQELWEITGILHDIDFEECHGMEDHALIARDLLRGKVPDEVVQAILAHNHTATS